MAPIPTPPLGTAYNGHANGADPKANNERLQIVDEEKQFTFVYTAFCTHLLLTLRQPTAQYPTPTMGPAGRRLCVQHRVSVRIPVYWKE